MTNDFTLPPEKNPVKVVAAFLMKDDEEAADAYMRKLEPHVLGNVEHRLGLQFPTYFSRRGWQ